MEHFEVPKNRWGNLTRIERFRKPIMGIAPDGTQYVADTHGPWAWSVRCDCGHEFEIEEATFPGRRVLRRCGRPQCPHTPRRKVKRTAEQRGVTMSVYLSRDLADQTLAWATSQGLSFSRTVEDILRKFFADELVRKA